MIQIFSSFLLADPRQTDTERYSERYCYTGFFIFAKWIQHSLTIPLVDKATSSIAAQLIFTSTVFHSKFISIQIIYFFVFKQVIVAQALTVFIALLLLKHP